MSNNGTWLVALGADPELITLGERDGRKLRCACNTYGKKSETRWFNAIVTGKDVEKADRLAKGDTILLSGQIELESYKPKKPRYKGEKVNVDTMPFARIMEVIKSETFFGKKEEEPADGDIQTEDPIAGEVADGASDGAVEAPVDDLPY